MLWPPSLVLAGLVGLCPDHDGRGDGRRRPTLERTSADPDLIPRSTVVAWLLLVTLGLSVGVASASGGQTLRGVIAIGTSLVALVLAVRWLMRA